MPPVMGAGAFIMAELLNVSYVSIAIAAAIPAILYFAAIYFSVDLFARRHGLQPMSREEMPRLASVIASRDTIPAFGSLIVLAWLLFDNYTPTLAGAVATMALIGLAAATRVVIALAEKRAGQIAGEFRRLGAEIWAGLVDGGRSLVMIATLLACAAILVTILNASGLGVKVSNLLLGLSSEAVLPVLIISAVLCILLGMDVPTTASYLLTAAVSGPLLVKLGVPPLTAHLFIFYFAILSALTPPVCASVYAAATLIGENFWKVAGQALRIAGGVYFIPFMFVYRQSLLFQGSATSIAYDLAITTLAIFSMSAASIGYFFGRVGWMERALLYVAAAMFFITPVWSDAVGAALIIGLGAWQVLVRGPAAAKAVAG
jgi:TRAP transporter 4TM/12TM fusion protein